MKINEKKLKRQLGRVDKWVRNGAQGTLEAATGFGKTYEAILAIKRLHSKYPESPIEVVLPGIDLLNDWIDPKRGHIVKHNLKNVKCYVINTYITTNHNPTLLIIDEIHNVASPTFIRVFQVAGCKPYSERERGDPFILGLTATMERIDGKHSLIKEYCPIVDTVTLEEARREGYVSDFKTYNLGLDFNEEDEAKYQIIQSIFNNNFAKFNNNFELAMACCFKYKATKLTIPVQKRDENGNLYSEWTEVEQTGDKWIQYLARENDWDGSENSFWSPKSISKYAQLFRTAMQDRKKMIYTASAKIDTIETLARRFQTKIIIFSENAEFADKVKERLGSSCLAYHTKIPSEVRRIEKVNKKGEISYVNKKIGKPTIKKEILDAFLNDPSILQLSTVKALNEGYNNPKIRIAIKASYDSSKRKDIQTTGRAARNDDADEEKLAVIINLYMKNSQEEKWLKSKQKGKRDIIWVDSVDDITMQHEIGFSLVDEES